MMKKGAFYKECTFSVLVAVTEKRLTAFGGFLLTKP